MIKNDNIRFNITLSKKQYKWLSEICKKRGISKSKFINWILSLKAREMIELLNINKYSLEELINIAKQEWL